MRGTEVALRCLELNIRTNTVKQNDYADTV